MNSLRPVDALSVDAMGLQWVGSVGRSSSDDRPIFFSEVRSGSEDLFQSLPEA